MSIRSNFSPAWKNSFGVCGVWTRGSQFCPHCFAASMATRCHFSRLVSASPAVARTMVRSLISGTIAAAPSSVAFSTINSMFLPFGMACPSTSSQASGGVFPVPVFFKTTRPFSTLASSTVASAPCPLKTVARSPACMRRTLSA